MSVNLVLDEHVATLTLAEPQTRNALHKALSDELAQRVAEALHGGARCLVLNAEGPAFCAGGSLEGLLTREHPLSALYDGVLALAACPVPTIAVVAGPAVGAGVTVALACDVILTTPEGRFDPRFLDLAIHPGGAHLWRLARRVGHQGAAALVLCGDALDGREAASVGLAWRCLPDRDEADAMAQRLATRTARRSPELVRRTKASLVASTAHGTAEEAFALELAAQEWSVSQPEHEIAVRAAVSRTS